MNSTIKKQNKKTKALSKIKVFCGYVNTGGISYNIAQGLRKNGIKADSIVSDDHLFLYKYHKKIKYFKSKYALFYRLLKYFYFLKHLIKYDVFIFNTRGTLLARKGDLKILRFFGKKTAMIYIGCDIRDKNYYLNLQRKYTVCKNCTISYQQQIGCIMEEKINEASIIQKYIGTSFSHPFDAMILKNNFHYLYLPLDLDEYRPNYTLNKKIKILHAPSNDGIKGTNYVIEAIERLKKENIDYEFELIRNKSHSKILQAINNCDVLIDQMVAGWYGLISIEAMAMGKTTICYIDEKLYEYLPDLPIINLNPDNLTEGIKNLINKKEKLIDYGKSGRAFVEKYHDNKTVSKNMLELILGETD